MKTNTLPIKRGQLKTYFKLGKLDIVDKNKAPFNAFYSFKRGV